jgi:hypothetical protein
VVFDRVFKELPAMSYLDVPWLLRMHQLVEVDLHLILTHELLTQIMKFHSLSSIPIHADNQSFMRPQ